MNYHAQLGIDFEEQPSDCLSVSGAPGYMVVVSRGCGVTHPCCFAGVTFIHRLWQFESTPSILLTLYKSPLLYSPYFYSLEKKKKRVHVQSQETLLSYILESTKAAFSVF